MYKKLRNSYWIESKTIKNSLIYLVSWSFVLGSYYNKKLDYLFLEDQQYLKIQLLYSV